MTPEQKQILAEKKLRIHTKVEFEKFAEQFITPFLEIFRELEKLEIDFKVEHIYNFRPEWKILLREFLQKDAFKKHHLESIEFLKDSPRIDELLKNYPNEHLLRFIPDFPVFEKFAENPSTVLKAIVQEFKLREESVYFYYLKYAFLLEVNFYDLVEKASNELFNFWHGDVVIFPKDQNWLIAFSMEEEWRFGRKSAN